MTDSSSSSNVLNGYEFSFSNGNIDNFKNISTTPKNGLVNASVSVRDLLNISPATVNNIPQRAREDSVSFSVHSNDDLQGNEWASDILDLDNMDSTSPNRKYEICGNYELTDGSKLPLLTPSDKASFMKEAEKWIGPLPFATIIAESFLGFLFTIIVRFRIKLKRVAVIFDKSTNLASLRRILSNLKNRVDQLYIFCASKDPIFLNDYEIEASIDHLPSQDLDLVLLLCEVVHDVAAVRWISSLPNEVHVLSLEKFLNIRATVHLLVLGMACSTIDADATKERRNSLIGIADLGVPANWFCGKALFRWKQMFVGGNLYIASYAPKI